MSIPSELRYSRFHQWARVEPDGSATVGITHHAQELLGDVIFVEGPPVGATLRQDEECGTVESVKAASSIYSPLSGEVVAVNDALRAAPEKINEDPYGAWIYRLRPSNLQERDALLDAAGYRKLAGDD